MIDVLNSGPFELLFFAAWAGFSIWAIVHVLLRQNEPHAAWAWITLCLSLPLGGAAWYWLFGINRVRTRARKRGPLPRRGSTLGRDHHHDARHRRKHDQPAVPHALSEVARTGDVLTRRPLLDGNALHILYNGEQAYPQMLAAIDAARTWIALEVYIFDYDEAGLQFIDALTHAKSRGVEIRCLLDGVGEFAWRRAGSELRARGLRVARFNPIRFWPPFLHINLRNHRKLLLVDGDTAFAGGMNLSANELAESPHNPHRVTDVHVQLQGPIVAQLSEMFSDDWRYASGEDWSAPTSMAEDDEAATPGERHPTVCRLITDGPNEDLGQLSLILLAAIANAQHRIFIVTPYFLPPTEMMVALESAAVRGVEVDVILPRVTDQPITHYAARKNFSRLMQRDVRIHYQPAPFCHAKLFVVDDTYSQFGSANFDPRSLRLNFEMMVEVYDKTFATALARHCETLREKSERVTAQRVRLRTIASQLRDAVCWLFSPYL
jgi:cardiolipin synthase